MNNTGSRLAIYHSVNDSHDQHITHYDNSIYNELLLYGFIRLTQLRAYSRMLTKGDES